MARSYQSVPDDIAAWIARQHLFFVATAPSGSDGHVNVSPKGYDSFRILDPSTVAYLDLTGSGVETIAHLRDNGRITVMFCAFQGPPRIVRLYGRGSVILPGDDRWSDLAEPFPELPGARSVIVVDVERVSSSCGYSIPLLDYAGERPTLIEWAERKGPDGVAAYQADKNATSIDGLPAYRPPS